MTAYTEDEVRRLAQHVQTEAERRNDALQVERLYAQMDTLDAVNERVPAGTYGPFRGSPDDTQDARIAQDDDASYWTALLAAPECATEEDA